MPFTTETFRQAMGTFATGVTVLTAKDDVRGCYGMTANAFMSVSLDPPLVLVSVSRRARLNDYVGVGDRFGINVLTADQEVLGRHFGGWPEAITPAIGWMDDVPVLEESAAHYIVRVEEIFPAGDHRLFLAEVENLQFRPHEPLLFHQGKFKRFQ